MVDLEYRRYMLGAARYLYMYRVGYAEVLRRTILALTSIDRSWWRSGAEKE